MTKVRWGVLGAAKIAVDKVVPAMQRAESCVVTAIASRDAERADRAAEQLEIPRTHGSYESLLADPDIDAIYIPLPNHLHVEWSLRCLEAGKHVLCEKPIGLNAAEAVALLEASARYPALKVMEAFMYRHHPQWVTARRIVRQGGIGALRSIHTVFSYFNDDPENIRNQAQMGGGGLMDIGCYAVSLSRWLFGRQPWRVLGCSEIDEKLSVDRLFSSVMDFGDGTATFTCSTQLVPRQRVEILGTTGRIEIEIPFNAPPNVPCKLWKEAGGETELIETEPCDQYTIQGELFARAVIDESELPTPLEDAVGNMEVLDALVASAASGNWATP